MHCCFYSWHTASRPGSGRVWVELANSVEAARERDLFLKWGLKGSPVCSLGNCSVSAGKNGERESAKDRKRRWNGGKKSSGWREQVLTRSWKVQLKKNVCGSRWVNNDAVNTTFFFILFDFCWLKVFWTWPKYIVYFHNNHMNEFLLLCVDIIEKALVSKPNECASDLFTLGFS